MTESTDIKRRENPDATLRRAKVPAHVMEAVGVLRSFLERMRDQLPDPRETIEWIK